VAASDTGSSPTAPAPLRSSESTTEALDELDFYALFLRKVRRLTSSNRVTPAELCEKLDLHKAQVSAWLTRAVADGQLEKLARPVRYVSARVGTSSPQPRLYS
jgi:hypothetical protein